VSFLLGDGVRFDVGADDEETEDDEAVKMLWAENRMGMLLNNIALSGCLTGHNVVRLEPRDGQFPRIVHINAQHFSAFWDLEDIDRVLWYRLQYTLNGPNGSGKRIDYVRGRMDGNQIDHNADGWLEIVYRKGGNVRDWTIVSSQALQFPFPPIVDWQNMPRPHSYYGADDIRKAVALNNAINLVASDMARILKHHGSPRTIGLGFDAELIKGTSIGGFIAINTPKAEADIFNLEMQSDLISAREFIALLTREVWQSARMVDPQTIKDTIGSLTNFGLRTLYTDALHKTQTKRQLYAEAYETITKRAMEMVGRTAPERVATVWPDVLPEDTAEITNGLLKEKEANLISTQTYREVRGYDHELEEKRIEEEKASEENLGSLMLRNFERGA
jgi:hypothetical protein